MYTGCGRTDLTSCHTSIFSHRPCTDTANYTTEVSATRKWCCLGGVSRVSNIECLVGVWALPRCGNPSPEEISLVASFP